MKFYTELYVFRGVVNIGGEVLPFKICPKLEMVAWLEMHVFCESFMALHKAYHGGTTTSKCHCPVSPNKIIL